MCHHLWDRLAWIYYFNSYTPPLLIFVIHLLFNFIYFYPGCDRGAGGAGSVVLFFEVSNARNDREDRAGLRTDHNQSYHNPSGAIIGDADRKRALILLLGLSPWYGTIFLFLEQIAPSAVAHERTCCEDFCECREGEMTSVITEMFDAFGPQQPTTQYVHVCWNFTSVVSSQAAPVWDSVKSVMSCFLLSLTKLYSAASFTRAPHYFTPSFTYVEE